ncbi:hypothetical protein B0I35DRAFT_405073 [Stachybotrys elegans]|uniref:Uncharacterized protein n=1 Tax=Stachybotrys elegans TaxID=80388 RepID=A0A8K0WWC1_9HYPO|nr:hypothetical protein B0I35DRAFT_405073 [Stachybotrys elegans]
MSPTKPPHQSLSQLRAASYSQIVNHIGPILRKRVAEQGSYVNDLLSTLDIGVTDLDLATGIPGHQQPPFIQPIPAKQLLQCLSKSQPWVRDPDFEPRDPEDNVWDANIWAAERLLYFLHAWLFRSNGSETPLIEYSNWLLHPGGPEAQILNRKTYKKNRGWVVWEVYYYFRQPSKDVKIDRSNSHHWDTSKPHITCVVQDDAPLIDGKISASELCAIVWLAGKRGTDARYGAHAIIPITVITLSGSQARIVQGNWNVITGKIILYKSRIMDLGDGPWVISKDGKSRDVHPDLLHLLGWFVGSPVGDTVVQTPQRR